MNYQVTSDPSRTHKKWLFESGWRLELYISHGRKARVTLFDNEGNFKLYREYAWHEIPNAEWDAQALLEFGQFALKESAA